MQPGCNSINTLTRMKSDQIEVPFPGRSSQLGIFSIYTGPSKLPSKTKFRWLIKLLKESCHRHLTSKVLEAIFQAFLKFGQAIVDAMFVQKISSFW
jgi:hypothetical protein